MEPDRRARKQRRSGRGGWAVSGPPLRARRWRRPTNARDKSRGTPRTLESASRSRGGSGAACRVVKLAGELLILAQYLLHRSLGPELRLTLRNSTTAPAPSQPPPVRRSGARGNRAGCRSLLPASAGRALGVSAQPPCDRVRHRSAGLCERHRRGKLCQLQPLRVPLVLVEVCRVRVRYSRLADRGSELTSLTARGLIPAVSIIPGGTPCARIW